MEKTTFTSGTETFRAFDQEGVLYNAQRIREYYPLKVANLEANRPKRVTLFNPQINFDLSFLQLRVNKANFQNANLKIEIYRGQNFIDSMTLPESVIPFPFPKGSVADPNGFESSEPMELVFTASKNLDELFIICEKCFVAPVITLEEVI